MKQYYTLLVRQSKSQPWAIEFGDYDKETVLSEQSDLMDGWQNIAKANTRVICTLPNQASITRRVQQLNDRGL